MMAEMARTWNILVIDDFSCLFALVSSINTWDLSFPRSNCGIYSAGWLDRRLGGYPRQSKRHQGRRASVRDIRQSALLHGCAALVAGVSGKALETQDAPGRLRLPCPAQGCSEPWWRATRHHAGSEARVY